MNPAVLSGQTSWTVTIAASFLIWLMFAGLLFLWFIDGRIKKEEALHALFASAFAWIITEMIKSFVPSLRPFQATGSVPMTLTIPFDASFPSGHSATAFALAVSVWQHNKKTGILFIICAICVAWGRVASNVHYFGDVFAGAGIGISVSYLLKKIHFFKLLK